VTGPGTIAAMTRATWRDVETPDPALEAELRRRLADVEDALVKAVDSDVPLVSEAGAYLLAAGGKRFRPLLVLLGGHFGEPQDARLIPGAVAIELTHLATLYHDDVIDEADARRGIPSVNARWDNTVAILTGDFLFARASEIASDLGTDVTRLLAWTIARVAEGQILEADAQGRLDSDEAFYMDVIRKKTASLIATSCRLGGMLSGAEPHALDRLERYGRSVGLAFQLSDDIMDVTADEATLGKEPGVDLKEGVYTLPVIQALRTSARREELRELLRAAGADPRGLAGALQIIRDDGALDLAREAVTAQVRRAIAEAEALPPGTAQDALIHLARFLAARCGAAV
jgi:heptaprenyl diphosphate synthase